MDYDKRAMDAFFYPKSVAIIGVSRTTGPGAFNILENLLAYGYTGRIYPVNPKATEILGHKCYARSADLPEVPELAIVTVPREVLPVVIKEACEFGIRHFTLVPQGLAEADATGAAIQRQFMDTIRRHGARVLGPNTLGTVNGFEVFMSSFMPMSRLEKPMPSGVICQTGLFLATDLGLTTGIGLGVDIGNQVDVGFPQALKFLGEDDRVKTVCIHMEGLRPGEGRDFVEVAQGITRPGQGGGKPVMVYKTARSAAGAKSAGSHCGSLAGSHQVYVAALDEAGVVRLEDVEDMDDTTKAFLYLPPPKGKRIFIVTVSGGGGIMAADACEDYGLELTTLTPKTMEYLQSLYPSWMDVGNPLDVWPAAIGKDYLTVFDSCFNAVGNDPNVDIVVCVGGTFANSEIDMSWFISAAAEKIDKPVVWWVHGRASAQLAVKAEAGRRVATYPSADRAVRSVAHLASYYVDVKGRKLEKPTRPGGIAADKGARSIGSAGASAATGTKGAAGGTRVLGSEAYDLLGAYGLPLARWAVAGSANAAASAAAKLGFPVALKPIGPEVLHKSELGVVRLNLRSAEEVAAAARDIYRILGLGPAGVEVGAGAGARASGTKLLLQEFLPGGHEVILGAKRDPHFGPTVLFGLGGIFTEILKDVAIGLAPLTPNGARRMVEKTKGYAILRGARGQEPADIEALVDALVRLSWLVADHPEIAELDLNPVKVFAAGKGCRVVDARIILG